MHSKIKRLIIFPYHFIKSSLTSEDSKPRKVLFGTNWNLKFFSSSAILINKTWWDVFVFLYTADYKASGFTVTSIRLDMFLSYLCNFWLNNSSVHKGGTSCKRHTRQFLNCIFMSLCNERRLTFQSFSTLRILETVRVYKYSKNRHTHPQTHKKRNTNSH